MKKRKERIEREKQVQALQNIRSVKKATTYIGTTVLMGTAGFALSSRAKVRLIRFKLIRTVKQTEISRLQVSHLLMIRSNQRHLRQSLKIIRSDKRSVPNSKHSRQLSSLLLKTNRPSSNRFRRSKQSRILKPRLRPTSVPNRQLPTFRW